METKMLQPEWWFTNSTPSSSTYPSVHEQEIPIEHSPQMMELPPRPSVVQANFSIPSLSYHHEDHHHHHHLPLGNPIADFQPITTHQPPLFPVFQSFPISETEFHQQPITAFDLSESINRPSVLAHGSEAAKFDPAYTIPYYSTRVDELLFSQPSMLGCFENSMYLEVKRKEDQPEESEQNSTEDQSKFSKHRQKTTSLVIPPSIPKIEVTTRPIDRVSSIRSTHDCQVCHSTLANGLHFGARTCAACAAFFRRTISDGKKYICKRSQRCTTASRDGYRKICRACRMKRCLEIGMMPENVQHKRQIQLQSPLPLPGGPLPGLSCASVINGMPSSSQSDYDSDVPPVMDPSMMPPFGCPFSSSSSQFSLFPPNPFGSSMLHGMGPMMPLNRDLNQSHLPLAHEQHHRLQGELSEDEDSSA